MTSNLLFGSCPRYTSPLFRLQGPPLIKHFNVVFGESLSPACEQSIDKHMTSLKESIATSTVFSYNPLNEGFNGAEDVLPVATYMRHFCLGKKQEIKYNLDESAVLNLSQSLSDTFSTLYFDNFFNSPTFIASYLMGTCMDLVLFGQIGK